MAGQAIKTIRLTKIYRSTLARHHSPSLQDLDLTTNENELFGFLGKNGAGKTTTIKILCGLIRSSTGAATVFGVDVRKRAARRIIGYLPENPYFYEYLTAKETLEFYGRLEGRSRAERLREWDRLSEMLDLREVADQRLREFSKGMRQRLGFAVALVGDPQLLILDEPMSGLDPIGRRTIRELMLRMRDLKKTIFFSSHVLGDVEQICDRVAILSDGKLVVEGRVDELLTHKVRQVEIIGAELPPYIVQSIEAEALRSRESEAGHHFTVSTIEEANDIVKQIQACGGRLVDFSPVKESLEDYFLRHQTKNYFKQRSPEGQEVAP